VSLTVTNEFTVVERLDFSGWKLVYAEFTLQIPAVTKGEAATTSQCTTFQNSIRTSDGRLLVLCQEELISISLLGTRQRVEALEDDGEWLEALALALDHYEATVQSLEDKRRVTHPVTRGYSAGNLVAGGERTLEEIWMADLLLRYLRIAVENAPESSGSSVSRRRSHYAQNSTSGLSSSTIHTASSNLTSHHPMIDLAQSHFQMLAGVCIEFCVVTRRLDLLFGDIFRTFQSVGYTGIFLDVLEPYVLNDKLHYIAPEAMAQFVEHCKASNDVATVERCLLHMDVTIMDFDSILSLLRRNGMYTALLHVFAHGLNDFLTPLEIILESLFNAAEECDVYAPRRANGAPRNAFEMLGYKALLYLRYSFEGRTFPQGTPLEPEETVTKLRAEMLRFLFRKEYRPSATVTASRGDTPHTQHVNVNVRRDGGRYFGRRGDPYAYLQILILVDAKVVLDIISLALDSPGTSFLEERNSSENSISYDLGALSGGYEVEVDEERKVMDRETETTLTTDGEPNDGCCPDRQFMVGILSSIISPMDPIEGTFTQSEAAKGAFLDFMAKYLVTGVVTAARSLTFLILERMASVPTGAKTTPEPTAFVKSVSKTSSSSQATIQEENIISLLNALPSRSYDWNKVLAVLEESHMTRAALMLHKTGVVWNTHTLTEGCEEGKEEEEKDYAGSGIHLSRSRHFIRAIDCYLEDVDDDFKRQVFGYIRNVYTSASLMEEEGGICNNNVEGDHNDPDEVHNNGSFVLQNSLLTALPKLVRLDAVLTAQIVSQIFSHDLTSVFTSLQSEENGLVLFEFLQAIISGDFSKDYPVAGALLTENLTRNHHQTYFSLMTKFHPEMVYHHLSTQSTHDNYKPEECLRLCQDYEIADASAYLLERMGNVSSALQLMLQTLESRMMSLKRIVRGMSDNNNNNSSNAIKSGRQRNSKKVEEKSAARVKRETEIQSVKQILVVALDLCERNSGPTARIEHGSQLWFNVLDRLINAKGFLRLAKELPQHSRIISVVISDLLQLIMQRMVSNVPLPDILHKITVDHAGSKLGEFRDMIMSMLKTYNFELQIFSKAAEVLQQDVQCKTRDKKLLVAKGLDIRHMNSQPLGYGYHKGSVFSLSTSSASDFTVSIHSKGNVEIRQEVLMSDKTNSKNSSNQHRSSHNGTHSAAMLSRLRRKATNCKTMEKKNVHRCAKTSLNMRTTSDAHLDGSVGTQFVQPRKIGFLPLAENFGRLG